MSRSREGTILETDQEIFSMQFLINGGTKDLSPTHPDLHSLIESMQLKSDRVAVELNGDIVPRAKWAETPIKEHDRLEIVHFVGGGIDTIVLKSA